MRNKHLALLLITVFITSSFASLVSSPMGRGMDSPSKIDVPIPSGLAWADLSISSDNVTFSEAEFYEGDSVTINISVFNNGDTTAVDATVGIYLGNPLDGNYTYGTPQKYSCGGSHKNSMDTGDINNDGYLDIVVGDMLGSFSIMENDRSGNFTHNQTVVGSSNYHIWAICLDDFNGDGWIDIAGGSRDTNLKVALNDGTGSFPASATSYSTGSSRELRTIDAGDIDDDGDVDILVGNIVDGKVFIFENRGDGTFLSPRSVTLAGSIIGLTLGDMDNDGDLDAAINADGWGYTILNNTDGDGNFTAGNTTFVPYTYRSYLGDLDNNGYLDFVATSGSDISYVMNNGSMNFTSPVQISGGAYLYGVDLGDYNRDGYLDILGVRHRSVAEFFIYENNGNGTFSSPITVGGAPGGTWTYNGDGSFGDVDNDGDLDLMAGHEDNGVYVSKCQFVANNSASLIHSKTISSFGNDSVEYIQFEWTVNGSVGEHELTVVLDMNNTISELSEMNNFAILDITIVEDTEKPVFVSDHTPANGTTGERITFVVNVTDNVRVRNVTVEYWMEGGTHSNVSMVQGDNYTLEIDLPENRSGPLNYIFHAVDVNDNWNRTAEENLTVLDNDIPTFEADNSDIIGYTGGNFNFNISVSDNIGVGLVYLEYWFGTGPHSNISVQGDGYYTMGGVLPTISIDPLHYIFHAVDDAGNWAHTFQMDIPIIDSIAPTIIDWSDVFATTGDIFTFNTTVDDNIGIGAVYVEYWFGTGSHLNVSMANTIGNSSVLEIVIPSDSTSTLYYIFHAFDAAMNHRGTLTRAVSVLDNDRPVFLWDPSDPNATTGEEYTFTALVEDNIGIQVLTIEYWYSTYFHENITMEGSEHTVVLPHNYSYGLFYQFHAMDPSGNWNRSFNYGFNIEDNDPPEFVDDLTASSCTTGEDIDFIIEVDDNIEVNLVYVEYWTDGEPHDRMWLTYSDGYYRVDRSIDDEAIGHLNYFFEATDPTYNKNYSETVRIPVIDNDKPHYFSEKQVDNPSTGDSYRFECRVSDNIGIERFYLEYWFSGGEHVNNSLPKDEEGYYYKEIQVPSDMTGRLHYIFSAVDTSGNWDDVYRNRSVIDNDPPELVSVDVQERAGTGNELYFAMDVTDNIGIDRLYIAYWFGEGEKVWDHMRGEGPYHVTVQIPQESLLDLNYHFEVWDEALNPLVTPNRTVAVFDDDAPVFQEDLSDNGASTGDPFRFDCVFVDNIGVSSITVEYWIGDQVPVTRTLDILGVEIAVPSDSLGELRYVFNCTDLNGNYGLSDEMSTAVVDNDDPIFVSEYSDQNAKAGEVFKIEVIFRDNIGVESVRIEYILGDNDPVLLTLPFNVTYKLLVDIPKEASGDFSYAFIVRDEAGNEARTGFSGKNIIPFQTVVIDEDPVKEDEKSLWGTIVFILILLIFMLIVGILVFIKVRNDRLRSSYEEEMEALKEKIEDLERFGMNARKERQLLAEKEELLEAFIGK